jgi:cysteinyl-tRNA synthetase
MSKSEGNFSTVRDILEKFDPIAVRLFMLSAHYRSPINFSADLLKQANSALDRIRNFIENLDFIIANDKLVKAVDIGKINAAYKEKFDNAMDDDLNTADAIGVIFEYIKEINLTFNQGANKEEALKVKEFLIMMLDVLGLYKEQTDEIPKEVYDLVEERKQVRKNKNFARADEIRDTLKEMGYEVKDTPDGVKISKI